MRKNLLAVSLVAILAGGVFVTWSVTDAAADTGGEPQVVSPKKRGGGNPIGGFFKSLGRLFRGDKKKKDTAARREAGGPSANPDGKPVAPVAEARGAEPPGVKIERISKKDVGKFEATGVTRAVTTTAGPSTAAEAGGAAEHLARGRALLAGGDCYAASRELGVAVTLDPKSSEAHNLLGVALDQGGSHDRAIESFKRALKLSPSDAQIMNNLGYSYYLNNDFPSAKKYLKRAAKLAPGDDLVLNNLAVVFTSMGKDEEALESFVRAGGEFGGRFNFAATLERRGRYADAVEYYEAAGRLRPDSVVLLGRLVGLYARLGRAADAQRTQSTLEMVKSNLAAPAGVSGK